MRTEAFYLWPVSRVAQLLVREVGLVCQGCRQVTRVRLDPQAVGATRRVCDECSEEPVA